MVEDQQVGVGDLLHHQLAHVLHVHLEGAGIHQAHDLIEYPVGGETLAVELLHAPHAVVLHDDLLGTVLLFQLLQEVGGQLLLVLHGVGEHVGEVLGGVAQVALLTAQEQGAVLGGKAVPEDAVDEGGLAGVQEAGDEINRNIHSVSSLQAE